MFKSRPFVVLLVLMANVLFAQNQEEYSKVKFVYEITPNYSFEEKGIVGTVELLKKEFPTKKIVLLESTNDSIKRGIISYNQINITDKENITMFLLHQSETIFGEYDKIKNRTSFKVFRNGTEAFKSAKKYLNLEVLANDTKGNIDYNKKKFYHKYPQNIYESKFKNIAFEVDFISTNKGIFKFKFGLKNEVEFGADLPFFVVPNIVFSNAINGVKQYSNIHSTVTLTAISYE